MPSENAQSVTIAKLLGTAEMKTSLAAFFALVIVFGATATYVPWGAFFFEGAVLIFVGAILVRNGLRSARAAREERGTPEFGAMIGGLDAGLVAYDQNFQVFHFNPAAERLFRVKADDIVRTVIGPQDAEKPERRLLAQVVFPSLAPRMVARTPAGTYPQVVDLSFDDPRLELRITTSELRNARNESIGFMKIVRDRTREVESVRAKNDFVAVASHQLRTPVTELNWALDTIAGDAGLPESAKTVVEKAHESAKHLLVLVEDLLGVARIEEGRFGYQFAPADITEFLGTVASAVVPRAERAGLEFYFDRPSDALPQVMIDKEKLGMVVSNLLDNAIRYNVEHGRITLAVRRAGEGPYIEVSVKDTGIGIPPEEIGKIFTKFFRAENAVKIATEGSGLGLYIARNIVRAHGGDMWAESELNRGTTFAFTMPTDPALVPQREAAADAL